jgi:hypothetical protein
MWMTGTVFEGGVSFDDVNIGGNVIISDANFNKVGGQLTSFNTAEIRGNVFFQRSAFNGKVNIARTNMRGIFVHDVNWPDDPDAVDLTGLTYQELSFFDPNDSSRTFLFLLDKSPYDARLYTDLENYYRNQGYEHLADQVYIRSKIRQLESALPIYSLYAWWSLFLGVFVLWGRSPLSPILALFWCLCVVVFGYFIFRKKENMVADVETSYPYRPFLYSLDLFMPFFDLGYAKVWKPGPERRFARVYTKIHQSLAWFLIPVAVLAIIRVIG